jgi:hypothetical protein
MFCGGVVVVKQDNPIFKPDRTSPGIWRYSTLLPRFNKVSYGEGLTPINRVGGVLVKNEKYNPTGSYLDRAAAILASYVKSNGFKEVETSYLEGFSSSLTYYVSKLAKVRIVVDDVLNIEVDGLTSLMNSGAELVLSSTPYPRDRGCCFIEYRNPLTIEGIKTIVFELFERGVKAEHIVVPVETGLLAYSISKGIQDLHEAGLSIDYQVVGVLLKNREIPEIINKARNIKTVAIGGQELLDSLKKLNSKGFRTKPLSAMSYAVAENLGSSVAVITMGFKPYKTSVRRSELRDTIVKTLKEKGPLTAYGIWLENPSYTLRGIYKTLHNMELKGELRIDVKTKGNRKIKLFKL